MAVTLASLCEKSGYLYGMRVIAGKDGMTNIVQWVHSVEDTEVSDFLHGGELIFSTGIANKGQDWMLPFVKNLIENQVSGLVLNIGPYIKSIPQEVISYCNEKHFPLLVYKNRDIVLIYLLLLIQYILTLVVKSDLLNQH